MKRTKLILVILCFSILGVGQLQNDSLWGVWNDEKRSDTSRLAAMHTLAKEITLFQAPDSAFTLAEMQLQLAERAQDAYHIGQALNTQGISWAIRGDLETAMEFFQRSYQAYEKGGLTAEMASALYNIGNVYAKSGEEAKGLEHMQRSLAICLETGNDRGATRCYHGFGRYHENKGEYDKALSYYQKSLDTEREIQDARGEVTTLISIGVVHKNRGDHIQAIEAIAEALEKAEGMGDEQNMAYCLNNLGNLYDRQRESEQALVYYTQALELAERTMDKEGQMHSTMNLGNSLSNLGRLDEAVERFQQSLILAEEMGDMKSAGIVLNNMGLSLAEDGLIDEGLEACRRGLKLKEEFGFSKGYANSHLNIGGILIMAGRNEEALIQSKKALDLARSSGNADVIRDASKDLAMILKRLGDFSAALEMNELHNLMRDSLAKEENQRALLRQEYKYNYDKQALADSLEFAKKEELKNLEIAKRDANLAKQRIGLAATGGGLLLLILLALSIRRGKKRSDELLHNILPEEVASELKQKGKAQSKRIEQVTVLFTDFKGFTAMAEQLSPKELVNDLNICFSEFDKITSKYGIEKIKTIGDAYMAAGGLPTPNTTHATDVIKAALEMRDFVEAGKARKIEAGLPYFEIRIGVHTGSVVAGIVGVKKFQYDIWGDTVNTASRMESSGEVGHVNISEATYELVKDNSDFGFTSRGKIEAKGKGEMEMYFVREN